METTVAIAEIISCERDHDRKTSGVPLVVVSANDTCTHHFYSKKIPDLIKSQKPFSKSQLQNQQMINQVHAAAQRNGPAREDNSPPRFPRGRAGPRINEKQGLKVRICKCPSRQTRSRAGNDKVAGADERCHGRLD